MWRIGVELVWSGLIALTLSGLGSYYLVREGLAWWRSSGYQRLPPQDRSHYRRQFYRRLQGSTLLVLAGMAIFVGLNLLDPDHEPRLYAWFWAVVLLGLVWMILISASDLIAIRRYARRHERQIERDRRVMIDRQMVQLRARGNGHWPGHPQTPPQEP